jgi:hypothetical protein
MIDNRNVFRFMVLCLDRKLYSNRDTLYFAKLYQFRSLSL